MQKKTLQLVLWVFVCSMFVQTLCAADWVKVTSPAAGETWTGASKHTVMWQNSIPLPANVKGILSLTGGPEAKTYFNEYVPLGPGNTGSYTMTVWGIVPPGSYNVSIAILYPPEQCLPAGSTAPCTKAGSDSRIPINVVSGSNLLTMTSPASGSMIVKNTPNRIRWNYDSLLYPPTGPEPEVNIAQCWGAGCDGLKSGSYLVQYVALPGQPTQHGIPVSKGGWDYAYGGGPYGPSQISIELAAARWIKAQTNFTLEETMIAAVTPKTGDQWAGGQTVNISWQYHALQQGKKLGITLVNLTPSAGYVNPASDPTPNYDIKTVDLAPIAGVGQGNCTWQVPNGISPSKYRLRFNIFDSGSANPLSGQKGIKMDWVELPINAGTFVGPAPIIGAVSYRYEPEGLTLKTANPINLPSQAGKVMLIFNADDSKSGLANKGINNIKAEWTMPNGSTTTDTVCTYPAGKWVVVCEQTKELPSNLGSTVMTYKVKYIVENNYHAIATISNSIVVAPLMIKPTMPTNPISPTQPRIQPGLTPTRPPLQ